MHRTSQSETSSSAVWPNGSTVASHGRKTELSTDTWGNYSKPEPSESWATKPIECDGQLTLW